MLGSFVLFVHQLLDGTCYYNNITLLQNFNNCARHARSQTTDITDHLHHHQGQLLTRVRTACLYHEALECMCLICILDGIICC